MIGLNTDVGPFDKTNESENCSANRSCGPYIERAQRLEAMLSEENQLPLGFRSLLEFDVSRMIHCLISGEYSEAARIVHGLTLLSQRYGSLVLNSEISAELRVLDLALHHEQGRQLVASKLI